MATTILAIGNTAATSASRTIVAGVIESFFLRGNTTAGTPGMTVDIEFQNSNGTWTQVGQMAGNRTRAFDLYGPKTVRFSRPALAAGDACGVDLT